MLYCSVCLPATTISLPNGRMKHHQGCGFCTRQSASSASMFSGINRQSMEYFGLTISEAGGTCGPVQYPNAAIIRDEK